MKARDLRPGDWVTRKSWSESAYLVTYADAIVVTLYHGGELYAYPQPSGWIRVPRPEVPR